jgi:3-oxoacyl-[acyl-carrier protein] reductase
MSWVPVGADLLKGRVAVVTGAGQGIGKSYAAVLARHGAAVMVADIDGNKAAETADGLKAERRRAAHIEFDQADWASVKRMVEAVERDLGPVDILVNNASLYSTLQRKDALDIEPAEWARVLDVNLTGPFLCCRAVMPGMISRKYGKIVNIASGATFLAKNRLAHYVAAKSGVIGLTRVLAREYSNHGITVNSLSPGSTDSGASNADPAYLATRLAGRAIARIETPDDLVGALLFLCSPMSDFMTGQNLVVDGGVMFN